MLTIDRLLDGVAEDTRARHSVPRTVALSDVFAPITRAHFPPRRSVPITSLRAAPDHCRIVEAREVHQYQMARSPRWASYESIAEAFSQSTGASKITRLPREVVDAPVKLLIRDNDTPIRCVVTADRVYPKRAWIAPLLPGWDTEMAYAAAGILNSAVGFVLYQGQARADQLTGHDLRKKALTDIPIPLPANDPDTFTKLALISYRLHCLYEVETECKVDLGVLLKNHRIQLLSMVVRLYGWSETETEVLLREAEARGLEDVPTSQHDLFFEWQRVLAKVQLLDDEQRVQLEELKRRARLHALASREAESLSRLQRLVEWEHRANSPIPKYLAPPEWRGVPDDRTALKAALRFLSERRGQGFGAERPSRVNSRLWEVSVFYSPPRGLKAEEVRRIPPEWSEPGKHPAGSLWIDAITGQVWEDLQAARDAIASGY